jgi:GT2 family glycosyltransferase
VLIDDGSTDGTSEMVKSKIKSLSVIRGKGDWWWAGSLQQGINWLVQTEVAAREVVMFANDDITFNSDFLQKALSIIDCSDGSLLLPFLREEKTGIPQESGVEADLINLTFKTATSPEKINCLPTRGLFMRMSELKKIGGFYPRLLPHYLSDYEFTLRAHSKGLRLITCSEIAVKLDREQSGYRHFSDLSFLDFLCRYFSKKNVSNPIYWSTFILLAVPKRFIFIRLVKVWASSLNFIFYYFRKSLHKSLRRK